ncbi:MAG: hypothetical protein NZ529_00475 [Cytophagaceae bacterium]|nr:hypothetical protein [Cytophagaceae bacterium]MDW8455239.1 hypothetical protein [Cytophagaceae bacterium]
MKKYLLYSLAVIAVLFLVFNLSSFKNNKPDNAQGDDEYIMVEIYEIPSYPDHGVHIHYGGNKREVIKFPGYKVEHHDDCGDIILNEINKLVAKGYKIEHTCAGLDRSGMITKIFMKKK